MGKSKNAYVVYVKLQGADALCSGLDEVMAGQPVVRRLNRMERVALAYDGTLVRRTNEGLLMSFSSANAALLGACEMQQRCAGLPQVSGNRLALQIGIHKAAPESCLHAKQTAEGRQERRDRKRRIGFDTARRLANAAPENGIIASSLVAKALDQKIRQASQPLDSAADEIPAQSFDWRNMRETKVSIAMRDAKPPRAPQKLVLRQSAQGTQSIELDRLNSITTFGRDPGCDVMVTDAFASRIHAHIEMRRDGCILTDHSANGTCVLLPDGTETLVRDTRIILAASGRLAFGHSTSKNGNDVFEFELIDL